MKKIYVFLLALVLGVVSLTAQETSRRVFGDLAKIKGVTSVYVSGAMMKYGLSQVVDKINKSDSGFSFKEIKNPGGIEIVVGESAEVASKLKAAAAGILKSKNSTMLVEVNDNGDNVRIFSPGKMSGNTLHDVIIETAEGKSQYTLIYIYGDIVL